MGLDPRSARGTPVTYRPADSGKTRSGGLECPGDEVSSGNEGVLNPEAICPVDLLWQAKANNIQLIVCFPEC